MLDIFKLTCNRLSIEMAKIKSADVEPLLSSFANFTTKSKKCSNVLWIISIFLCLCEYVCASVDLVFFHSRALTRMHRHRYRHRIAIERTLTTNTSHIESCMACSFCRFVVFSFASLLISLFTAARCLQQLATHTMRQKERRAIKFDIWHDFQAALLLYKTATMFMHWFPYDLDVHLNGLKFSNLVPNGYVMVFDGFNRVNNQNSSSVNWQRRMTW